MKIRVVGVQNQDYKLDSGFSFKGVKVHAIDMDSKDACLQGNLTTTIRLAHDSPFPVPEVGKEYSVYFTQKGAVDYLAPVTK